MVTKVLQFIGKGQITIPQEWRAVLGLEEHAIKATLAGDKIILEPFPIHEEKSWKLEMIAFNELPKEDRKLVREGRKAYRKGKKEKFMTSRIFFRTDRDV